MRDYELVLVIDPDVGDDGLQPTVDRITTAIQERGGAIQNIDLWGRRRLAYPINHKREGYYVIIHAALDPQTIRALEAYLDLAEDVMRHLITRREEIEVK